MAQLSLFLLGPPKVTLNARPVTGLKHDKVLALLAYLAVEAGRPHRRDALIGLLWPDSPQTAARNSLRQALTILRQAIGDPAANPPYLFISRSALQLNQDAGYWLDVTAFTGLLAASERHRHRRVESCKACARRLQQAVDLYQGDFLDGFFLPDSDPFEEWALLTRESLRLQMMAALGQLARYHEGRGRYRPALAFARRQLTMDPWREEVHRQVMRILALIGERSAAVVQYETCCRILAEDLGVEPEAETTTLYEQIRDGAEGSSLVPVAPAPRPHNLPPQPTPFVGREEERAEIGRLLDEAECRLLTVTGPGGVGKTRLALQVATEHVDAYAGGVYFVSLASLPSAGLLAEAIANALQIAPDAGDEPASQLIAALHSKEVLLVLDDFEHLLDGAPLLADILQRTAEVNLLVTSRERLNLHGEWTFLIRGLPVPDPDLPAIELAKYDAVKLFVQSASRAESGFSLSQENGGHVARICQLVAGLPLAIELAAAWVRVLSCEEIAQEVARSLAFLESGYKDMPQRHRSMEAVFDHSWALLSPKEQDTLQKLSVFRGGFHRPAASAVTGASLPLLAALVDKSLLQRTPSGRYAMHGLLRQYAGKKLLASDEVVETQAGHLNYYLELAETAAAQGDGAEQIEWLDRLESENDNLRAALAWALSSGCKEEGLRLAVALYRFWYWRNHYREGRQWLDAALTGAQALPAALRAQGLRVAGVLAIELNDDARAESSLQESLALYRQIGDLRGVAAALNSLGAMAFSQKEYERAILLLEQSLSVRREQGDTLSLSTPLNNLGLVALAQGDSRRAKEYFEEALALDRTSGDAMGIVTSLSNLAAALLEQGLYQEAQADFQECLLLFQELGDNEGSAECLEGLAAAMAHQGNVEPAARLWGAAQALRHRIHAPVHPAEQPRYDRTKAIIQARLDEATLTAAWSEGRAMSLTEAIDHAITST